MDSLIDCRKCAVVKYELLLFDLGVVKVVFRSSCLQDGRSALPEKLSSESVCAALTVIVQETIHSCFHKVCPNPQNLVVSRQWVWRMTSIS